MTQPAGAVCCLVLVAGAGAACAQRATPPAGKTFSIIDPGGLPPDQIGLVLPDTLAGGGAVAVRFYTWGSSSCTEAAGEDVTAVGQTVTIMPYDRAVPPDAICTADLRRFERQISIRVPSGEVLFQLRGRRADGRPADSLATLSRTVTVIVLPP
jgi:hypothetical protein